MKKTLIVNLFGGPGTGKSTMMASIFAELKWQNIMCEMVPEIAKKYVWRDELHMLTDQRALFEETLKDISALIGKVDVVVTDSPLIHNIIYANKADYDYDYDYYHLKRDVVYAVNELEDYSLNIFLQRKKIFRQEGRLQSEEEAISIDQHIRDTLKVFGHQCFYFDGERENVQNIVNFIKNSIQL